MIKLLEEHMKRFPPSNKMVVSSYKEEKKKDIRQEELEVLSNKLLDARKIVDEIIPILDSHCSRYVDILNDLLREKEESNRESKPKGYTKNKKKNKKKSSKKMYNKIAAECHPDKTDDEEMHEKFLRAKECLENDDEFGIFEIFKEFSDEIEDDDLINFEQEIIKKTMELAQLTSSNGYKIAIIYKSGETKKAKSLYLEVIMRNIQQIEQEMM